METRTEKVYLLRSIVGDYETVAGTNLAEGTYSHEYILLGEAEVTFTIRPDDDLVKSAVESLERAKEKVRAEAQRDLTKLDLKIQSLLAITHQD